MLLKRFYDDTLAQASYLVGCGATGQALVVDPNRDVAQYVEAAAAEGLRITHVTETHIHADFVSGSRELAERTSAALHLSGEGLEGWRYRFASTSGATLLRDGNHFTIGKVRIDVVHTPGHTPEHLTFLVTDTAGADRAMGALTGDFIFAGDVGRPDLLERAAREARSADTSARQLFRSLRSFAQRPDYLQLWPGHGAGSACGRSLGAMPQTTLGYERLFNWAFGIADENAFVDMVLAGQPEPPSYFAEMKRVNRDGPPVLGRRSSPPTLSGGRLAELLDRGELVVDTRPVADFAAAHVPRTINIPAGESFVSWAGWLVPYDRDIYLIADASGAAVLAHDLGLIGLDRVQGHFELDALDAWADERGVLARTPQISVEELASHLRRGIVRVVDVRARAEWDAGHLPGADNVPLGLLVSRLDELRGDRPLVLHCQTGFRSSIGASVLEANGVRNFINLDGGFARWREAGNPVEREERQATR